MARGSVIRDRDILELALVGLESQRDRIDEVIRGLRSKLGIRQPSRSKEAAQPAAAKRRTLSVAGRRKIALAQKKRWAAAKAQKAGSEKPARKPKRKLSAAGRAATVAPTKKRLAADRAAKKASSKQAAGNTAAAPTATPNETPAT
jgi:hypothetical protein